MNRKILLIIIIAFSVLGILVIFSLKPRAKFDKLNIGEEEWNSIIASREVGSISLKSLKFNDYELVIDDKNNKVYYSVIKNSSSKFTPFISYIASTPNAKMAILNDEITEDKIMNNHEFKIILYDDNTYKIYGLYCTSFPMLNIVYDETKKTENFNISMSMYLFNNFDNGINRSVRSDGTFNKTEMEDCTNNYKFSLVMTTPGNNERENVISLLHMKPSNVYFLNAINIGENTSPLKNNKREPREKIKDIENRESKSEENIMNTKDKNEQRVELFINNKYEGLYSLSYDPNIKIRPRNK